MKKFTKIIENINEQKYFQIISEVTLIVKSETEGEAGYLADSIQFESYNIGQNQSWIENDGFLQKSFQFKDFKEALDFINKVGKISESMNHHPEITNVYNKVTLKLKTHDKNQITDLDYQMAKKVDQLFNI
jgi:4a-hydroxytetrahydrobiopterin dehydratase